MLVVVLTSSGWTGQRTRIALSALAASRPRPVAAAVKTAVSSARRAAQRVQVGGRHRAGEIGVVGHEHAKSTVSPSGSGSSPEWKAVFTRRTASSA